MVTQIFPQGSALAHLPFFGRGSTQCKGPLSRQMASRSAKPTSNLRVRKSFLRWSCHHRHTGSCQANKAKQNKAKLRVA